MAASTPLRVFLAHSKEDKSLVLEIYYLLQLDGFMPWIDKENLVPGHDWKLEIEKAVQASHVVVAFISSSGMDRAGYLHKELALAVDVAQQQPEGAIYLIPMCLDGCEPPKKLSHLHFSGFPREMVADIYVTLQLSLLTRAASLGLIANEQLREMPTTPVMVKNWTPSSLRPGRYLVRGRNPETGKYYGIAKVERSGDEYVINWNIGGQEIKGRGDAARGDLNGLVRIWVQGEYEMIFSPQSWSGIYEGTWGSGGIEQFIPASPIVHIPSKVD